MLLYRLFSLETSLSGGGASGGPKIFNMSNLNFSGGNNPFTSLRRLYELGHIFTLSQHNNNNVGGKFHEKNNYDKKLYEIKIMTKIL